MKTRLSFFSKDDEGEDTLTACRNILQEWDLHNPKSTSKKPKKTRRPLTVEGTAMQPINSYIVYVNILLLFIILDQVDKIIKTSAQASSVGHSPSSSICPAPLAQSRGSRQHQPVLSKAEKKKMLLQYGYASDEEIDET